MRFTKLYAPTIKEAPADSDLISYEYLVRGGFIRKVAAGIFTYLPLGNRVLQKITQIVREEMDNAGCQELLMPIAQPANIWKESGRWDDYGPEMMKLQDRHNRAFTLGPTHEEMITVTVKNELVSYKELPKNLYQINTKYRDEIRPRFGLLRAREFIMKDAYSFHTDEASLDETYNQMYKAYEKILERMGLDYMAVEADSGAIGGSDTHEFVILAENGESSLLTCKTCGYKATDERAEYKADYHYPQEQMIERQEVSTPDQKTIEQISEYLNVDKKKIVKSLLFKGREGYILALIRGDLEINFAKLKAHVGDQTLELAQPEDVLTDFGTPIGFIGPVGLNREDVKIVGDLSVRGLTNFVTGAMKQDAHFIHTNLERDFQVDGWHDIKMVTKGDACPVCSNPLDETRGIEMGQVFKLGQKYSKSLGANFTDESGQQLPFHMGCYGWGISRSIAGVVEQLHDENGILWPISLAPYHIIITLINPKNEEQSEAAETIYNLLKEKGEEVLLDDRENSPGSKFKDADLIGIPIRVTVGRGVKKSKVELKLRNDSQKREIDISDGFEELLKEIKKAKETYDPRNTK
jgi:prolyl-tRNA synthetase